MRIELFYPHKSLWPNGRAHHFAKAREVKKHRSWAHAATLEALQGVGGGEVGSRPIPLTIEVHGRPKGPLPDADNIVAAAKSQIDGVADALGLNDRDFSAPRVVFAAERDSRFVLVVGGEA